MRINNNLMAMNAYRQLGITNNAAAKAMEKLSSGYRINRAGDDAAGLAISEKMRAQIRGLNMASKNAQDGISLIQTAEGALQESHAILQRMRELAVQAANDTNVGVDRAALQAEVHELAAELTRIAETTEFNTQKLLDGQFSGTFHIGANKGQNINLSINKMTADALKVGTKVAGAVSVATSSLIGVGDYKVVAFDEEVGIAATSGTVYYKLGLQNDEGKIVAVSADGETFTELKEAVNLDEIEDASLTSNPGDISFTGTDNVVGGASIKITTDEKGNLVATATWGIDISEQENADKAIETINNAIEKVSTERAKLGAYQNRLEHTIRNLDTSAENLQAAESRIRDVDMAKEMMEFTKYNILQQAATAMLAQANQAPQGVLQLLR